MENFFVEENFMHDIGCLLTHCDIEEEDVKDLPEDWDIEVEEAINEPMFKLDAEELQEMLFNSNEERYSEEGNEDKKIIKALNECIDFEKLNSMIPKLWYGRKTIKITKKDLLEYVG